ncbi:MAG: hypothetical protein PHF00_11155 [Elusimicrobia bacterium]|nr:hypothetical protein [Elusimicrobiota bacterium]
MVLLKEGAQAASVEDLLRILKVKIEQNRAYESLIIEDVDDPMEAKTLMRVRDQFLPDLGKALEAAGTVEEARGSILRFLDEVAKVLRSTVVLAGK